MVTVRTVAGHGVGRTFHASPVVPGWGPRGWWDLGGWLHLLMHTSECMRVLYSVHGVPSNDRDTPGLVVEVWRDELRGDELQLLGWLPG